MKKVFKSVLLLSFLAASLLSCSHLFDDEDSGGGVNQDSLGGKGREVKLEKITKPSIGDVVYYTDESNGKEKGRVTTTSNYATTGLGDDHILGYVYAINGDTISVVSKTVHTNQRWAASNGGMAVYSGKLFTDNNNNSRAGKLSEKLSGVKDGYSAWKDRVAKWNTNATFTNYQAISRALADKKDSLYSTVSGKSVSDDTVQEIVDGPKDANGNRPGDSIKDKWYLPNTTELETIYRNLSSLANDKFYENYTTTETTLSGKSFWSCEVKETDANNYNVSDEHYAEYVSFDSNDSGTKEADKYNTQINVIAVANFKYSSLQN